MSVHFDRVRGRWIVRWRDNGSQRARRFADEAAARDFGAGFRPPPAEFLIGTGARISEALAVRWPDVDLDAGVARISRQRARGADGTVPTKGKRCPSVQIGPRLSTTLRELRASRADAGKPDVGWLFLCPPPLRGRYAGRTEPVPPSRRTAHDWHGWALEDAGLRHTPLHALRHTAAIAWLATGHPLIFVQRQLGNRSITTTEEHYGHLETSFVREAAARHRGADRVRTLVMRGLPPAGERSSAAAGRAS